MKNTILKFAALLLVLCMVLPMAACGNQEEEGSGTVAASAQDVFNALLENVQYDTEMSDYSDSAEISYIGLPEGAKVTMYAGNARYADELTWIVLASADDMDAALEVMETHLDEKHDQFLSYHAGEVPKISSAPIWKDATNIILCITGDYTNAQAIMDDPSKVPQKPAGDNQTGETTAPLETEPTTEPTTDPVTPTEPDPTDPPKSEPEETDPPATNPPRNPSDGTLNSKGYPAITTEDTWHKYETFMVVDNVAYEYYGYSDSAAQNYAKLVSSVANALQGEANVYSLVIPTAVGVVYPDNLAEIYPGYEDQSARLEQIFGYMDDTVIPVNIFEKLMQHRDEYLYYRTDWHWSAIGAYYGYEKFCEVKGIAPYTMDDRIERVYEGYKGPFASASAVAATPDTVYAYEPYFYEDVSMVFTETDGDRISWPVIANGDTYGSSGKYLIFAAGDQPVAEFTNTKVTDGSVAIVVKESFGNAMMPYFPDHYSTVYEVDYRYWEGNLVDFAREVGATDIIFANNIGMVRSSYLIGLMDRIIP